MAKRSGSTIASQTSSNRTKHDPADPAFKKEIQLLLFLALAAISGFGVLYPEQGVINEYIDRALSSLLGVGRFGLPIALLLYATTVMLKRNYGKESSIAAGITAAMIAIVTAVHIPFASDGTIFAPGTWRMHGGLIGQFISFVLTTLFGNVLAYILVLLGVVAGVLAAFQVSITEIIRKQAVAKKVRATNERLKPDVKTKSAAKTVALDRGQARSEKQTIAAGYALQTTVDVPLDKVASKKRVVDSALEGYKLPPLDMLEHSDPIAKDGIEAEIKMNVGRIENTLMGFNIEATVTNVHRGPTVTRYEIAVDSTVKLNKIASLEDNLALVLASHDVHIIAPIPGKSAVGIDVPNKHREVVKLGDVYAQGTEKMKHFMDIVIGVDISGKPVFHDLREMPHLLVAGTTGSGKSIYVSSLLTSLLMQAPPDRLKMIMIDLKKVELSLFADVPHLLTPVVIDLRKVIPVLNWVVKEMENRYELLRQVGVKNIKSYNTHFERVKEPQNIMPYIVVVIDELADLFMTVKGEAEHAICRLAQLARAVGIHLIVATQRPSYDVVTGLIKANFPSRIAFSVSSNTDSRVILDSTGAERLSGKGDMLFMSTGSSRPARLQGAYISEDEIQKITAFIKRQAQPVYDDSVFEDFSDIDTSSTTQLDDPLAMDAIQTVVQAGMASASLLQRKLKVGYARAARLIDIMENRGVVGPYEGSKPRSVLMSEDELDDMLKRNSKQEKTS